MPYMYILECADGSYYTGSTWNLERRLAEHQSGVGARHTAKRLPVRLVYCEYYDRITDAFQREKQVQGWSRRKKQALIEENADKLVGYSRNYTQNPPPEPVAGTCCLSLSKATSMAASTGSAAANSAATCRPPPEPVA